MALMTSRYDREALDRDYDVLGRFADSHKVFSMAVERVSDRKRATDLTARLDVDLGDGLVLDLFPAPERDAPLVIFFHGGLWRTRPRSDFAMAAAGLGPHGCAVAVVDGCLLQVDGIGAAVENAQRAVLWLRNNAALMNASPEKIVLLAHGLGSIPATMAALCDFTLREDVEADDDLRVAGLAVMSGVFELEPLRQCFLNVHLGLDMAAVAAHQPLRLVGASGVPLPAMWLAVGEHETNEFHRHMVVFARAAERAGAQLSARTVEGHNHFSLLAELANPSSSITSELIAMIGGS